MLFNSKEKNLHSFMKIENYIIQDFEVKSWKGGGSPFKKLSSQPISWFPLYEYCGNLTRFDECRYSFDPKFMIFDICQRTIKVDTSEYKLNQKYY